MRLIFEVHAYKHQTSSDLVRCNGQMKEYSMNNCLRTCFVSISLGFAMIVLAMPSMASTTDGIPAEPGVISEEVVAKREARRQEIANMSDEERAAAREQRRQADGKRGGSSDAEREARRERYRNMSDEERQAMRDRMGKGGASGGRRQGQSGSGGGSGRSRLG